MRLWNISFHSFLLHCSSEERDFFFFSNQSKVSNSTCDDDHEEVDDIGGLFDTALKTSCLVANIVLVYGVLMEKSICFQLWMVLYGAELAAGWAIGFAFLVIPGIRREIFFPT
jgi:hypothetical protein